jgi:D-glycero-D-manno-heptose 1,7-bisphosphate phosphatase
VSGGGVFLDRDGTLIEDPGYLTDPQAMRLLPGAAQAVARLNAARLPAIVVTNQSGIARGLITETDYLATAARLEALLAEHGARLDAQYHCPHHPEFTGPCDCRKPGDLLYRRAAERFGLDLARSWWIGDRVRDVAAARAVGGQGVLVLTGAGRDEAGHAGAAGCRLAADLPAAVALVLHDMASR